MVYASTRYDGLGRDVSYTYAPADTTFTLTVSAHPQRVIALLTHVACPTGSVVVGSTTLKAASSLAELSGAAAAGTGSGYYCDNDASQVWLYPTSDQTTAGAVFTVKGIDVKA